MIRCLVFDFDGVLVDTNEVKRDAFYRIFQGFGEAGRRWVSDTLELDVDSDRFRIIQLVIDQAVSEGAIDRAVDRDSLVRKYGVEYNDICEEYATNCPEIAGAEAGIATLSLKYPLYINSATPEEPLRRIVANRGWSEWFKAILGRPGTKLEHLIEVMEREAIAPEQLAFVGDGKRDMEAARTVGCQFVGIRNAFNDFETTGLTMLGDMRPILETVETLDSQLPASAFIK